MIATSIRPRGDCDDLVCGLMPTARRIARSYHSPRQQEDLEQVAYLALVKAARRYRPERGGSFQAYAIPTIYGELKRHFRDHGWDVHVPRVLQERALAAQQGAQHLAAELGRRPTATELGARLGWDAASAREALNAAIARDAASLDRPLKADAGADTPLERRHGELDDGFEHVERRDLVEHLLSTLTPLEREVVALHYFAELSNADVAERLGLSPARVSRMLREAIACMRDEARADARQARLRSTSARRAVADVY